MKATFIALTNLIIDGMRLCRYDEHVKAWKWRKFMRKIYGIEL